MGNHLCVKPCCLEKKLEQIIGEQLSAVQECGSNLLNESDTSVELSSTNWQMCKKISCTRLNKPNNWGMTPLHLASESGQTNLVHVLLLLGADVSLPTWDNHGNTIPLVVAASGGHLGCIKLLLQFGAKVNQTDGWGNSAIFKASCYNYVNCVEYLLKNGANPNCVNKWGALPLQYAALQGHDQVVQLLLEHGAITDMWGDLSFPQALTAAASRGHHKCINLLVDAGVPVNLQGNVKKHTPLEAMIDNHPVSDWDRPNIIKCLRILINNDVNINSNVLATLNQSFHYASYKKEHSVFFETLLCAIPYSSDLDEELSTLFIYLAEKSTSSIYYMKLILNLGYIPTLKHIQVNIQNNTDTNLSMGQIYDLSQMAANPRHLADLCRIRTRGILGIGVQKKVMELPVPNAIKDFLKLLPVYQTKSILPVDEPGGITDV